MASNGPIVFRVFVPLLSDHSYVSLSAQPPYGREDFVGRLSGLLHRKHGITLTQTNHKIYYRGGDYDAEPVAEMLQFENLKGKIPNPIDMTLQIDKTEHDIDRLLSMAGSAFSKPVPQSSTPVSRPPLPPLPLATSPVKSPTKSASGGVTSPTFSSSASSSSVSSGATETLQADAEVHMIRHLLEERLHELTGDKSPPAGSPVIKLHVSSKVKKGPGFTSHSVSSPPGGSTLSSVTSPNSGGAPFSPPPPSSSSHPTPTPGAPPPLITTATSVNSPTNQSAASTPRTRRTDFKKDDTASRLSQLESTFKSLQTQSQEQEDQNKELMHELLVARQALQKQAEQPPSSPRSLETETSTHSREADEAVRQLVEVDSLRSKVMFLQQQSQELLAEKTLMEEELMRQVKDAEEENEQLREELKSRLGSLEHERSGIAARTQQQEEVLDRLEQENLALLKVNLKASSRIAEMSSISKEMDRLNDLTNRLTRIVLPLGFVIPGKDTSDPAHLLGKRPSKLLQFTVSCKNLINMGFAKRRERMVRAYLITPRVTRASSTGSMDMNQNKDILSSSNSPTKSPPLPRGSMLTIGQTRDERAHSISKSSSFLTSSSSSSSSSSSDTDAFLLIGQTEWIRNNENPDFVYSFTLVVEEDDSGGEPTYSTLAMAQGASSSPRAATSPTPGSGKDVKEIGKEKDSPKGEDEEDDDDERQKPKVKPRETGPQQLQLTVFNYIDEVVGSAFVPLANLLHFAGEDLEFPLINLQNSKVNMKLGKANATIQVHAKLTLSANLRALMTPDTGHIPILTTASPTHHHTSVPLVGSPMKSVTETPASKNSTTSPSLPPPPSRRLLAEQLIHLRRVVECLEVHQVEEREKTHEIEKKLKIKEEEIRQLKEGYESQLSEREFELRALRDTRELLYLQVDSIRENKSESVKAVETQVFQAWQEKKKFQEENENLKKQMALLKEACENLLKQTQNQAKEGEKKRLAGAGSDDVEDILEHDREQLILERKELQENLKKKTLDYQNLFEEKEEREAEWKAKEVEWKRALIQRDAMYEKLASTPRRHPHAPPAFRSRSFSLASKLPNFPSSSGDLSDSELGHDTTPLTSASSSASSSSSAFKSYTLASQLIDITPQASKTGSTPTSKSSNQNPFGSSSLSPSSPYAPPVRKAKDDLFLMN